MVAKAVATLLLVLCILPTTAPFSSVGSTNALGEHNPVTTISVAGDHSSVADAGDEDALVLERSNFLKHSRLCASAVVGFCETASTFAPFLSPAARSTFALDLPPLRTVLRL